MSKQQAMKQYEKVYLKKEKLGAISKAFQQYLLYMEYTIKNQTRSFSILSICGGEEKNRFILDKRFPKAFESMNLSEKIKHYQKSIEFALKGSEYRRQGTKKGLKQLQQEKSKQEIKMHLLFPKRFNSYEDVLVTIKEFKIVCGSYNLDARNFLLRSSNKKDRKCMALQAIHNIQPETLRFSFRTAQQQRQFLPVIANLFDKAHEQNVIKMSQVAKINRRQQTQMFKLLARQYQNHQQINSPEKTLAKHMSAFVKNIGEAQDYNANLNINSNKKLTNEKSSQNSEIFAKNQSIVEQIMKQSFVEQDEDVPSTQILGRMMDLDQQKAMQALNQKNKMKYKKNLFELMLPNFLLTDLDYLTSYISVFSCYTDKIYIYRHCNNNRRFRMELSTKLDPEILMKAIFNIQLYKAWHPEVNEGSVRIRLTSQNSAIVYQKHKRYSQWYRQRDFLYLRHLFTISKCYYIVDKAITNAMFFPFQSITRGAIQYAVWRVNATQKGSLLVMQIVINHEGLFNDKQQQEMTIRYLKGFTFLEKYFSRIDTQVNLNDYFGFNWQINPKLEQSRLSSIITNQNEPSVHSVDFNDQKSIISNKNLLDSEEDLDDFYTVKSNDDQDDLVQSQVQIDNLQLISSKKNSQLNKSKHEIQPHHGDFENTSTLMKFQQQKIKLNEQGLAILPNTYLSKKHIKSPIANAHFSFAPKNFHHSLLKNDWEMMPKGGLRLIHQQKIKAQNNVFKFLLKKIGSSLLSGKGATGISLPVEIFNIDSNLQRDCFIMATAPNYLEKAFQCPKGVQRFKDIITFGFTTMYLFLDPEKPFNPILGQTYQGFIAGCPIYAQQISHHPPITAVYMVGRGYKIHANFETKVAIHMNSADGINEGFCNIVFDDGQRVIFQTPIGQISGLNYGDRSFNFKGKAYYLDQLNKLYAEIRFQQVKGYFSKSKWKYIDQLEGEVSRVTPQFVDKFLQAPNLKKPSPEKSQILQKFHELSGRWTQEIFYDQEIIIRASQISPYQLKDYEFPLNSNSNYREDIIYRKKLDISRSQLQKQRLEVAQRADRKLRQNKQ